MRCPFPNSVPDPRANNPKIRLTVPCGKCAVCKQNRRLEWAIRLTEEAKDYLKSSFVTLTYKEDIELPDKYKHYGNINKTHLQNFIKRLRNKTKKKIRYYAVGEYGSQTSRPHYHVIIFGLGVDDSRIIQDSWSDYIRNDECNRPLYETIGNVYIGDVNIRSMMYVAKYHTNKTDYPDGLEPPFCLMSKGIGRNYIARMKDYHNKDIETYFYQHYEQKKSLPRYYKDRLFNETLKKQIAAKYQNLDKELIEVEEYIKKYPKNKITGYYRLRLERIKTYQKQFKEKSKLNSKL